MKIAYYASKFKKDYKREQRRKGADIALLKEVMQKLIRTEKLEPIYYDHALKGNYKGRRELHIKPDWLLIYKLDTDSEGHETIYFERTGSHADLFDK